MRRPFRLGYVLIVVWCAGARSSGQEVKPGAAPAPPASAPAPARVLGSHHIDRYEAIRQLRAALTANPNLLNDWIILGELAQEVAADVPADRAAGYYRLARQSYEAALRLSPSNASLKAAAQFAREQEQGSDRFAASRRQSTAGYLAARRAELSRSGPSPTVRVYAAPRPAAPAPYYYQPYVAAQGPPYSYQQYSRDYFPTQQDVGRVDPQAGQAVTATERAALVKPGAAGAPP